MGQLKKWLRSSYIKFSVIPINHFHNYILLSLIAFLIDDNKRDDLTLGDNSIDAFKIEDKLVFTMFMSCISNLFVLLEKGFQKKQ